MEAEMTNTEDNAIYRLNVHDGRPESKMVTLDVKAIRKLFKCEPNHPDMAPLITKII